MKARIFSTLILWSLTIVAIVYGKNFGWSLVLWILAAGATLEASALCEKMALRPLKIFAQISCAAIMMGSWLCVSYFNIGAETGTLLTIFMLAVSALAMLKNPFDNFWQKSFLPTLLLILAIPFMLHWLVVLGEKAGVMFSVMILAAAKFSDVGAFVFGKGLGRHRLAPKISPNKTWEGAIGGIFSSATVAACIAWGFWDTDFMPAGFTPLDGVWVGAIIGATAIVSDLFESIFKRRADIKDSGGVIPGIGGMLDLADSILLSAPVGTIIFYIIG